MIFYNQDLNFMNLMADKITVVQGIILSSTAAALCTILSVIFIVLHVRHINKYEDIKYRHKIQKIHRKKSWYSPVTDTVLKYYWIMLGAVFIAGAIGSFINLIALLV